MTWFEFFVTYAVCWWLVLFMTLPHRADAPVEPGVGHAPSAPENPRLRQKFKLTTLIAIIPAIAMYFIVAAAHAEETIYHVGSGCKPLDAHKPSSDIDAKDGYGTGDKKVKPATIESKNILSDKESFDIPVRIPTQPYVDGGTAGARNVDLSQSFVSMGDLSVSKDGTTTLNGQSITPQETYAEGCGDKENPAKEAK